MSDREDRKNDDGRAWGFLEDGAFILLPKLPLLRSGLGPPPFEVEMPGGWKRQVVHDPNEETPA